MHEMRGGKGGFNSGASLSPRDERSHKDMLKCTNAQKAEKNELGSVLPSANYASGAGGSPSFCDGADT